MLAQNFLTYRKLHILKKEHEALIKMLGGLERDEFKWHRPMLYDDEPSRPRSGNFNMEAFEQHCGTVCCIAGWCDKLYKTHFVDKVDANWNGLDDLFVMYGFTDDEMSQVRPIQAAMALRNYLTTGNADWNTVMRREKC